MAIIVTAVVLGLLASLILSAALQFAATAAACRGKGMCRHVYTAVTAHAQVTFSTLLNKKPPEQCSRKRPFSTTKIQENFQQSFPTQERLILMALSCLIHASS